jgi:hypothetical protein
MKGVSPVDAEAATVLAVGLIRLVADRRGVLRRPGSPEEDCEMQGEVESLIHPGTHPPAADVYTSIDPN